MNKKEKKRPNSELKKSSPEADLNKDSEALNSNPPNFSDAVPTVDEVANSFFNPNLYKPTKITFNIKNTTTNTSVKDASLVEIIEIMDRGLTLQLPSRTCARGHNLMIEMTLEPPGKSPFIFRFTAKVDEVETLAFSGGEKGTLSLVQFDEVEWAKLCKSFDSKQTEIENYLKAARGY